MTLNSCIWRYLAFVGLFSQSIWSLQSQLYLKFSLPRKSKWRTLKIKKKRREATLTKIMMMRRCEPQSLFLGFIRFPQLVLCGSYDGITTRPNRGQTGQPRGKEGFRRFEKNVLFIHQERGNSGDFRELKKYGFLFMVTLVIQLLFLRLKILKKNYFKSPNQPQRGLNLNHNSTI